MAGRIRTAFQNIRDNSLDRRDKRKARRQGNYQTPPSNMDVMDATDTTKVSKGKVPEFLRTSQTRVAGDYSGAKPVLPPEPKPQVGPDAPDVTADRIWQPQDPMALEKQAQGKAVKSVATNRYATKGLSDFTTAENIPAPTPTYRPVPRSPQLMNNQAASGNQGYAQLGIQAPPQPQRRFLGKLAAGIHGMVRGGRPEAPDDSAFRQAAFLQQQGFQHAEAMQANTAMYQQQANERMERANAALGQQQAAQNSINSNYQQYAELAKTDPFEASRSYADANRYDPSSAQGMLQLMTFVAHHVAAAPDANNPNTQDIIAEVAKQRHLLNPNMDFNAVLKQTQQQVMNRAHSMNQNVPLMNTNAPQNPVLQQLLNINSPNMTWEQRQEAADREAKIRKTQTSFFGFGK